jgi:hypothetical protein
MLARARQSWPKRDQVTCNSEISEKTPEIEEATLLKYSSVHAKITEFRIRSKLTVQQQNSLLCACEVTQCLQSYTTLVSALLQQWRGISWISFHSPTSSKQEGKAKVSPRIAGQHAWNVIQRLG